MQEKQEVLAELPLGGESCRNSSPECKEGSAAGASPWRGVSGLERHTPGKPAAFYQEQRTQERGGSLQMITVIYIYISK